MAPDSSALPELNIGWRLVSAIAWLQALVLAGNGLWVAVTVIRDGITGPAAVASAGGVITEVVIFLAFAAGMGVLGALAWRGRRGALTPFLLAQLLALTVGVPLVQAESNLIRVIGVVTILVALLGAVAWFLALRDRSAS